MEEKIYTLTELITNLRNAKDPEGVTLHAETLGWTTCAMLGLPASNLSEVLESYERLDADLTAAGL